MAGTKPDKQKKENHGPKHQVKELPPNNDLKRYPDEAYGDTEIPSHKRDKVPRTGR